MEPGIQAVRRSRQRGHGLAEYCLVVAAIALIALGLYIRMSGGVQDLWSTANSTLVNGTGSGTTQSTATTSSSQQHK